MKLNSWQWIGVAAIVLGGILFLIFRNSGSGADGPVIHAPQTMPAT